MSENPQVSFPSLKVYPFRNESLFRLAIEEARKLFFEKTVSLGCFKWCLIIISLYKEHKINGKNLQEQRFSKMCAFWNTLLLLSGELELIELTVANELLKVTHVTVLVENDDGPCLWHVRV